MAKRSRRTRRVAAVLLAVGSLATFASADDGLRDVPPVTGVEAKVAEAAGVPVAGSSGGEQVKPERTRSRAEEGAILLARAQRLLAHVQAQSSFVPTPAPLHPTASLFALSSYTPALDRWAASTRRTPAAFLARFLRPPDRPADSSESRLSILSLQRRIVTNLIKTFGKLLRKRSSSSTKTLGQREAEEATLRAASLLEKAAYDYGVPEAGLTLGDLWLWGGSIPGSVPRNVSRAMDAYHWVADLTGNATAQAALGFLYSTGYGDALGSDLTNVGDQASALLYHTFAALGGDYGAEQAAGYRHWAGIGTKQSCQEALPFYKSSADRAMRAFNSGPPGGLHLPPHKIRLSDRDGGVYGPGASVASTGMNKPHANQHHPVTISEWEDVLEFYQFHASRGDPSFMFRLGRIYYQGFGTPGDGITDFGVTGGRDFAKALKWFLRIARAVWPRDPEAATGGGSPAALRQTPAVGTYDPAKDPKMKVDEHVVAAAGLAAGFLGKMYMRGEGVPRNYAKAFLWLSRGAKQGDRESHNGLGIMYRDGLGVAVDTHKAIQYFSAAAQHNHAEAAVNLGKFYLGINDFSAAGQNFEAAMKNGENFQSFYYLAELNAMQKNRPDLCHIAVAFYKRVSERGDWHQEVFWKAERAWTEGDEETALLGFWQMAERGYEVAQNNVAYMLDRDKRRLRLPKESLESKARDRLALTHWTRSAAQDNIDALVKMGDYYLSGLGSHSGDSQPEKAAACYQTASNMHISALSMWNLGWMHENGIGVSKDFHLAKRYYDLAFDTNTEATLPVTISLLKLYARSLWEAVVHGDTKSLSIFTSSAEDAAQTSWWTVRRIREEVANRWFGKVPPSIGDDGARQPPQAQAGQQPQAPRARQGQPTAAPPAAAEEVAPPASEHDAAQRALQQDDDPIEWARTQRERVAGDGEDEDEMYFTGDAGDDVMETVGILLLCLGAGMFLLFRQQREQANARAEAMRQAGGQAAPAQAPAGAPAVPPPGHGPEVPPPSPPLPPVIEENLRARLDEDSDADASDGR